MRRITRVERSRLPEDPNRAPIWLIGLTDLITILLAFFILLYSTAEPRNPSFDTASQSLRDRLGDHVPTTDRTGEAGSSDAAKTWQTVDDAAGLNLDYLYSLTKKYLATDAVLRDVTVWRHDDAVVLSFGTELGFVRGDANLSAAGSKILAALMPFLNKLSNRLEVVGHADTAKLLHNDMYATNWKLSLGRADTVARLLADKGYDGDIAVLGRGTSDADMLPDDLSADRRNALARRVDLRLNRVR